MESARILWPLAAIAAFLALPALPASPALPAGVSAAAQPSFEQTIAELKSPDRKTRLRATQLLKEAAYPEAAAPLAAVVTDKDDQIQREAIAGELHVFLAQKVVLKERVAFVVERRGRLDPDASFAAGPFVTNGETVPDDVLIALRTAFRDDNPQVMLDAMFTFATLAVDASGGSRNEIVRGAAPTLAGMLGLSEPAFRIAALQVAGRIYDARVMRGTTVDPLLGDAIVGALNDRTDAVRAAAYDALGAMRYDRAVQALIEIMPHLTRDPMGDVAMDAAARIAHPGIAALLKSELTAPRRAMRRAAIEGLARLGAAGATPVLGDIQSALTTERDPSMLLAGHFAAVMLVAPDGAAAILPTLIDALSDERLQGQAVGYLLDVAPGRVSAFAPHMQSADPRIRQSLADVLGLSADPAALPLVERLTSDPDPGVQRAAARAVARLRRR